MNVPLRSAGAAILLVLLGLAVYAPLRQAAFVDYDDDEYVTENPVVRAGLKIANLPRLLTDTGSGTWHPLTMISHALDLELFGLNAGGHHLTSLLLHLANVLLLFALWRRLSGDATAAALLAGLFAIHPLNVESVAWISERKNVLSTLFWLLTLLAYLRHLRAPGKVSLYPALAFFMVGLMAKPMLVTLPLAMLLLDFWPLHRFRAAPAPERWRQARALLAEKSWFFVIALVFALLTVKTQNDVGALAPFEAVGIPVRLAQALAATTGYVVKALWPHDLAVFYPLSRTLEPGRVAAAAVLLALGTALAVRAKRREYLGIGWLWFIITLLPVSGLVQSGMQGMADRYFYVPGIGLFIMVAQAASQATRRRASARGLLAVAALVVFGLLAIQARRQVAYWQSSTALFTRALAVTKDNAIMHNNLGRLLINEGRLDEGLGQVRAALRIAPNLEPALANLGVALMKQGRHQEALEPLERALALKPDDPRNHHNLASALAGVHRDEEALRRFAAAVRLDPGSASARRSLAWMQGRIRQTQRARSAPGAPKESSAPAK